MPAPMEVFMSPVRAEWQLTVFLGLFSPDHRYPSRSFQRSVETGVAGRPEMAAPWTWLK